VPAVCCIYHKPKRFDESSDEDSSDSESESDCDHGHNHHHTHGHSRGRPGEGSERSHEEDGGVIHELEDKPEPNAYEVAPGSKKGKRKAA
jgi:protein phosphatase 1 regulatory subunit 11